MLQIDDWCDGKYRQLDSRRILGKYWHITFVDYSFIFSHLLPQSFNSNGFFFLLTVYRVSVISRFQTAEQSLRYHKRIGQQCDSNRNRHKVHKAFCVG